MADAVPVAKRTGAHCVAIVELAEWLEGQGVEEVSDPNLGGTVELRLGLGQARPRLAHQHAPRLRRGALQRRARDRRSAPPPACVIKIGGTTVYHAGDTCLFGDMKLIAERNPVDVALLPIGGHYTMDRHDAVVAAEFIGAGTVIPMHYDTFPPIETDAEAFKAEVEAQTSSQVVVLKPGETHSVWRNAGQAERARLS